MDVQSQAVTNGVTPLHAAPQWYAIWTRSRHEQVVREQLEQKQIEAFLPTITKWSRWKDRKKKSQHPRLRRWGAGADSGA
jgi:hypothetical protein